MVIVLKRFLAYYRPHKKMFMLDMLASLAVSVIGMLYPIITRNMLNDFIPNQKYDKIILFGVTLFGIYLLRFILRYFIQYYGHIIGVKMQAAMRKDMFLKLESLPYSYFDNHETGQIMSRMTADLFNISELAHHGPENVLMSAIMILCSFVYLASINLKMTIIIFLCVPLLVAVTLFTRKKMTDANRESKSSMGAINAALENSISGIRVTKAFNNAQKELEKFEVGNQRYVEARKHFLKAMATFHSSSAFITDIFNVICLISGGVFLYRGEISFGDYSAFIVSINLFINPINTLIQFVEQFQDGATGFERFMEIMDAREETQKETAKTIDDLNGDIVFDHVSFSYGESKEVLNDISFTLKKGKTLALVGPSGGGKTTICHLLPAFYQFQEGDVRIDGKSITDISHESLRKNIGIVQQDVFLFGGTFYDNILYGRLDATEEEVIEAAKKANIYDYIMSLPDGFLTDIGERGVRLSGGQKQRLSIARVFLKNPPILVLDEATSALDNTTEALIQKSLDTLREGRTTLVVAHRLSTIKNADEILVIANGKIVEQGNHQQLLDADGIYKQLYLAQFKDFDLNVDDHLMNS